MRMLAKDPDMRPTMDEVEQTLPLAGICRKPTLRRHAPMLAAG
jgi:hypothetical protein